MSGAQWNLSDGKIKQKGSFGKPWKRVGIQMHCYVNFLCRKTFCTSSIVHETEIKEVSGIKFGGKNFAVFMWSRINLMEGTHGLWKQETAVDNIFCNSSTLH